LLPVELAEGVAATSDEDATTEAIGFAYLLKATKYFKVGRSSSFERRSRELAIQLPEKAEAVHVIRTDDPVGIELYWHRRFESKRKNGEWFELNAQDVKAFKRRKFM
jgi:Meiotically Up-regulated Gene 113 (MUG113) protein